MRWTTPDLYPEDAEESEGGLGRAAKMKNKALAAPYLVWMALFTIVPLAIVAYYAFTDAATGNLPLQTSQTSATICLYS